MVLNDYSEFAVAALNPDADHLHSRVQSIIIDSFPMLQPEDRILKDVVTQVYL